LSNWDAAWVFLKHRTASGQWQHGLLAPTGHTAPAGTTVTVANDGGRYPGAFIHRSGDGQGSLVNNGVRLKWDYASSGLRGTNLVDLSVHGIEMVYVPTGAFYLGSEGVVSPFYEYPEVTKPFLVTSEAAIAVGPTNGHLHYDTTTWTHGDRGGPLPGAFPKGHAALYWPASNNGTGVRGGSQGSTGTLGAISDRSNSANSGAVNRNGDGGGRGVRTAP